MAEEFQAAVYGGNWWMSPRTAFNHSSCSSVTPDRDNHGPFWSKNLMNMKSKSSDESSDGSMVFQDAQNPTTMLPDSAFQMMVAVVSDDSAATATIDWNQNLLSSAQEGMINTYSTIGDDDGSAAEIEAEHQQSLNFTTSSTSSIPYGYPLSLVQSLFINNYSPPYPPPPSHQPPFHDYQSNSNNLSYTDNLTNNTVFKRPRLETPSPLPTFKVRKEKLGDRITALQQLVSPFGKTDTASVLHEAIEYIKLLHDQVNILSASYIKGATNQLIHDKVKDVERHIQDLRSQGLCLVPVSDMFPVATDGFWTQTYEGSFK